MGEVAISRDLRNIAGPIALAYETNLEPLSVIEGPTGGGKTESSVRRILRIARNQHPSPKDGIRKLRVVCVGLTYRDLWDKAIPSYLKVFNKNFGHWTGGKGDPATHIMDFVMKERQPNGNIVDIPLHIEVWFRAQTNEQTLETFVRGLETTCWWLQEMDQLPEDVVSLCANRCGRYPEPDDRWEPEQVEAFGWPPAFTGVWGDTNTPIVNSWFYTATRVTKRFGNGYFKQPPALLPDGTTNPRAENLANLRKIRPDYYGWLKSTQSKYDNDRLLMCKPGFDRRGKAVYDAEFRQEAHVVRDLSANPSAPLIIACDTGNTLKSAAVFMQPRGPGSIQCLHELSPFDKQWRIDTFAAEILRVRRLRFSHVREVFLVVDPAARSKINVAIGGAPEDITYGQYLQALTGFHTELAETNDPGRRQTAGAAYMTPHDGLFIDEEHCPHLIAAMAGGYCFRKIGNAWSPEADKNDYSHVAEAYEYGCLKLDGQAMFFGDRDGGYGGGYGDGAKYAHGHDPRDDVQVVYN